MTASLTTLATKIQARLPHKTFPAVLFTNRPTFAQVREIEKLVEQNAGSITSSLAGTGAFNHIYLTKTAVE